jgi:hypothetical protein
MLEERYDYREAGRSAAIGGIIFIVCGILLCITVCWTAMQSFKVGYLYMAYVPCGILFVLLIGCIYGGVKLMMGMWEQNEIEVRSTHGL